MSGLGSYKRPFLQAEIQIKDLFNCPLFFQSASYFCRFVIYPPDINLAMKVSAPPPSLLFPTRPGGSNAILCKTNFVAFRILMVLMRDLYCKEQGHHLLFQTKTFIPQACYLAVTCLQLGTWVKVYHRVTIG